jgi:uncharacterized protein
MDPVQVALVAIAVVAACTVSAAAGYGGSLILVPALALLLGAKTGTALAALILAANNIFKVGVYRKTLPFKKAAVVVILVAVGSAIGAFAFVSASERVVAIAVIVGFVLAFVAERFDLTRVSRIGAPLLALGAGATSPFSGTSGPLKGLAVRNLGLDRLHLVGTLALVSLVGDATKTAIWTEASLISRDGYLLAAGCVPLMFAATLVGRRLNGVLGERGYTGLFWTVMVGYTVRIAVSL